jgi:peptide/nickel transport system substrate-binding protein
MGQTLRTSEHNDEILLRRIGRRELLKRAALIGMATPAIAGLLTACADDADEEDVSADQEEDQDDEGELEDLVDDEDEVEPEDLEDLDDEDEVPADVDVEEITDIPRERTLYLRHGGQEGSFVEHDIWNMYAVGSSHQIGGNIIYEPLAYYSAFADEMIPWLAEDWEYNDDSTQLTITTRSGVEWSDGEPFSARDVAFTLNHLLTIRNEVQRGDEVARFVENAEAIDENTVVIDFHVPAPRFFYFMSYKFDIGLYIVPQHLYEDEDWTSFTAFDIEQGLPVTTGPWRVAHSSPQQKIIDRADSWWAVDQGLVDELPRVERLVYLPFGDETNVAQQVIANQLDTSHTLQPMTVQRIIQENPNIITHTFDQPPYGYVDWWPTAVLVNHEEPPFDEREVRWAMSYFIDREQMIEVAKDGASGISQIPMPRYPGLMPFHDYIQDLFEEYDTTEHNPERGQELLEQAGFELNSDGWWERDGEVLGFTLNGSIFFADVGPIVAEMLRRNGMEAEYAQPPDWWDNVATGNYRVGMNGHGGSVGNDPYDTLRLFQANTETFAGGGVTNFTRWSNDEYDAIVDEIGITSLDDQDRLLELFRQAMEIWIPELPNIQLEEFYHHIPMNTTYWEGWPTVDNPYVNAALVHLTWQLVLNELNPVQ